MRQDPDYCVTSGKTRYQTKSCADKTIRRLKEKSRRTIIPKRSYHCKECNGWHLTSHPRCDPVE